LNKLHSISKNDPEWIHEIVRGLLDINLNSLNNKQIKMLRDLYLDNLRDGLKPRKALKKAYEVVLCFGLGFLMNIFLLQFIIIKLGYRSNIFVEQNDKS
jgi:hypothetical protein